MRKPAGNGGLFLCADRMLGHMRIPVSEWLESGREFQYRGHAIFVRGAGPPDAETLLLIHGFPTASWDWEALWPSLARRYRVLALDLLGFGFSDKPRRYDYSLVDQAGLCEAYLRSEGVSDYHVLAHDYGDSVAQELLARQDEPGERPRLRSVAFLNGGLFPETHRPVLLQKLLLSPLGPVFARLASRDSLASSLRRIFGAHTPPDDRLVDGFWALMQHNDGRSVMHRLIRYIPERRRQRERWLRAMQTTALPLKLIDGCADPISGGHMVARYRELVPDADVTELPDIGHYPQVEAPDAVLAAYLAFRDRIRPAP
jgi:pimeloyl-ACP methyl ester carboxylesterase